MNPTIRQFLFLGALTLGLTACPEITRTPLVLTIDPADGAAEVPVDVTVRAELSLPDGQVDVSTLTDETVTLTDAAGTPVEAGRMMVGSVLEVDPAAELEPGSIYTFTVTSALQTENGVPVTGASSTFTTARDGNNGNPDGELSADRERVVFSAGGASSNDLRTLTLTNTSTETLEISGVIEGKAAAQFSLAESAFSLAPGEVRTLELTFTPSGLGPQLATLVVTSSSSPTLNIPLGGLGVAGQGGELEPSLQWIFDTYGLPVDSGDDDASSTPLVDSKVNGTVGDEVFAQTFSKASPTEPVTVEVLATFGVENDPVLEFGYYAAGSAAARTELFTVEQTPGLNEQRLAPELNVTGGTGAGDSVTFDPGAEAFGFYSYWPTNRFFGERTVYTEDALNTFTDAVPHQVRAYPLVNADGSTEANAYVLATEEFSRGFDYNDVVFIVRNVTPGTGEPTPPGGSVAGLEFTTPVGLPYSDRLVLHHINNTTGNLCDPTVDLTCDRNAEQWAEIVFRNTGVVRLENTGGGALQLSLSVTGSSGFVLPNGETSVTLPSGDSFDLTVQFAGDLGDEKGVFPGTLNVQAGAESAGFGLVGIYMPRPEGGREVYLEGVVNEAFGYQTDLGTNSQGGLTSAAPDTSLAGDEVRATYWRAADASEPVVATQLAAFHSCCRTGEPFELWAQGAAGPSARMRHDRVYSQTIYPSLSGESGAAELSADIDGPFEIRVAGYSTDPTKGKGAGNLGVRLWPLKDAAGRAVANTYIVAQDFVEKGCGTSEVANCDYNDNLFVVSNIAPTN